MPALWERLRHLFTGPQLPWMIVWLGLATLIVGLIVLTRTKLGPIASAAQMRRVVAIGPSAVGRLCDDGADRDSRLARRKFRPRDDQRNTR